MNFGSLRLGWGRGRGRQEPAAPSISAVTISPAGGPVGTVFSAGVTWTGYPRTGIAYEWRDGGVAIPGETGQTYESDTTIAALTVEVTIDNGVGSPASLESGAVEVTEAIDALLLNVGGDALLLNEGGDALLLSEAA